MVDSDVVRSQLSKFMGEEGAAVELEIGRPYAVQALEYWDGNLQYYIHTCDSYSCPYPFPAEFFSTIETGFPAGWSMRFDTDNGAKTITRISFPAWVNDNMFYEKLLENDPLIYSIYREYQEHI